MNKIVLFWGIFIPTVYAWDTALLYETHEVITGDVITHLTQQYPGEYPDLELYKNKICAGTDTETHGVPDGANLERWLPTEAQMETWFTSEIEEPDKRGALSYYRKLNDFAMAYTRIGNELHLVQDAFVPAHQRYCYHDGVRADYLEAEVAVSYGYSDTVVDWTFPCVYTLYTNGNSVIKSKTFEFWLTDSMDDDDDDATPADVNDGSAADGPVFPYPPNLDVPNYAWGTYGLPNQPNNGTFTFYEELMGHNSGFDAFKLFPNRMIIQKQLKLAFLQTETIIIARSRELPPLIPIIAPYGSPPSISPSIFGPHRSPATIKFTVMENRKPNVRMTILCGSIAITEADAGPLTKIYDGKEHSVLTLGSGGSIMPWEGDAKIEWGGRLASGGTISDGTYTLTIKVKDEDNQDSETRSLSVKYDATPPTGTITIEGI